MLDIKDLEVGKKYRHVAGDLHYGIELDPIFTVSAIDSDGDAFTSDASWYGKRTRPWCICDDFGGCTADNGILKFEEVV